MLISSMLHDSIEDCFDNIWEGYSFLKKEFNKEIADIVLELTSNKDEIKHKYDGSKTNYLIDKMKSMSDKALTIKLSDRLQNISDAFTASEKFRNKYHLETKTIIEELQKLRSFNKIQKQLIVEIEYKLNNISQIFKI